MNAITLPKRSNGDVVIVPTSPLIQDDRTRDVELGWGSLAPCSPTNLLAAWARAIRLGRPDRAAIYRRLLDDLSGEEPTWEDAEWR